MPIFALSVWARVYLLAILVKEMSNFGNSCKETQIFFQILVKRMQKFGKFCPENATHGTFDVEISLAKGIIFRKIGLANGAILKPWAAYPGPKFSREPPPHGVSPLHRNFQDVLLPFFLSLLLNSTPLRKRKHGCTAQMYTIIQCTCA